MKQFNVYGTIIVALFLAIFVAVEVGYINNTVALLNTGMERQLAEVARQGEQRLRGKIDGNLATLEASAKYIGVEALPTEERMKRLWETAAKGAFLRVSYASRDGWAQSSDGKRFYVGDRAYFQHSMRGKQHISEIMTDRTATDGITPDGLIIVASVPIHKADGMIDAILFSTMEIGKLSESMQISFFDREGYSFVMDVDGKIIFHPEASYLNKNFFDEFCKSGDEANSGELRRLMREAPYGVAKMNLHGTENFVGFANFDEDMHGWSFVVAVPADDVFGESSTVIRHAVLLMMAMTLTFLALILYILFMKNKNDQMMAHLAFTDHLTKIRNFNKFQLDAKKKLEGASQRQFAFIYFDIDGFKVINDTFGYSFGDQLLTLLAQSLQKIFTREEIYGRLSNDHFAVLLPYQHVEELGDIAERIGTTFSELCRQEGVSTAVVLSAGIYLVQKGETNINQMLNKANMAKGIAKGKKDVLYAFFDETIRQSLLEESRLVDGIREALKKALFEIYYQPKYSLLTGAMTGAEALIRWPHPERGFISPAQFIPVAERNNLIVKIGRFVFEQVCRDIGEWKQAGYQVLPVAVNLSMIELYQKDLIDFIQGVMKRHNISPNLIEVEITESTALSDIEMAVKIIKSFKALGIRVQMDDFGTGYSSLSHLRMLPIDVLKLDRSFLLEVEVDERSRNIAQSIVSLAKSLSLEVVAEGVETETQRVFLCGIGCDCAQGFLFARPMPKLDLGNLLRALDGQ